MSTAIVPVVPKRNAVTGAGYPTSLALGELAVNTTTGDVYLGADPGVVQIGVALAAGTTLNLGTGDGSTVAFAIAGGTGTDAGGYLVSVGGIDQPGGWTVAGTTLTFSEAPPSGVEVSVRAILKGIGGSGGADIGGRAWAAGATYTEGDLVATSQRETWICIQDANTGHDPTTSPTWWAPQPADAVSLQLRAVAATAPTDGQFLMWSAANNQWEPTTLAGGSVTFNTEGTHYWRVPAYTRYARVQASAGNGTAGTNGQGTDGENGTGQTGANGINGYGAAGAAGRSVTFDDVTVAGGTAGQAGSIGYGGGGGGYADQSPEGVGGGGGNTGNGPDGGGGGGGYFIASGGGEGGIGHGGGTDGGAYQGPVGIGASGGGDGGQGWGGGGSGGGGGYGSGGGGGGGGYANSAGHGGKGGTGSGATAGGAGETLDAARFFTAGALVPITISAGAGTASITITY